MNIYIHNLPIKQVNISKLKICLCFLIQLLPVNFISKVSLPLIIFKGSGAQWQTCADWLADKDVQNKKKTNQAWESIVIWKQILFSILYLDISGFHLNVPSDAGCNTPHSNITLWSPLHPPSSPPSPDIHAFVCYPSIT